MLAKSIDFEIQCCSLEVAKATKIKKPTCRECRLNEVINNLKAEVEGLQLDVIDAEGKASRSSTRERKAHAQLSNLQKSHGAQFNPIVRIYAG
jgi:hypothetical protein